MSRTLPFIPRPSSLAKSTQGQNTDATDLEVLIRILKRQRPLAAIVVKDLVRRMLTKRSDRHATSKRASDRPKCRDALKTDT